MPDVGVLTLIFALKISGIQFVLTKHENAAPVIAKVTEHRTGAPGILVTTFRPGALNGVNAVANADQDRMPWVMIESTTNSTDAQSNTDQV